MNQKINLNIQHALIELNAGKPLLIKESNGFSFLIASAENITDQTIKDLKKHSGSDPSIIINKNRMNFLLKRPLNNDVFSLFPKDRLDADICHKVSFANTVDSNLVSKFHFLNEKNNLVFAKLLELFKRCQLIPAIVYCSISRKILKSEVNDFGVYTLKCYNLDKYLKNRLGVNLVANASVPLSVCKESKIFGFKSEDGGKDHFAIVLKSAHEKKFPLVRIHSQCITGDLLGSLKCDCGSQLTTSLDMLAKNGGILIYLNQEGRDIGFLNKIHAYGIQNNGIDTFDANNALGFDDDQRNYFVVVDILKTLGVTSIRLITNNPDKMRQLEKNGIKIHGCIPIKVDVGPEAKFYIETKKKKSGHKL